MNDVILVMCAHACAFMWTHGSQNMPDILLVPMSLLFCPLILCWGFRQMYPLLAFNVGSGDLNSGSHICAASIIIH